MTLLCSVCSSSKEGCEDVPTPNCWSSSPHCSMPDSQVQHEVKGWERLYPWGAEGDALLCYCPSICVTLEPCSFFKCPSLFHCSDIKIIAAVCIQFVCHMLFLCELLFYTGWYVVFCMTSNLRMFSKCYSMVFRFCFRCGLVGKVIHLSLWNYLLMSHYSHQCFVLYLDAKSHYVDCRLRVFQRSLLQPLAFLWITAARTNPSRDCRPMSRGSRHTRPSWLSSQGALPRSRYG